MVSLSCTSLGCYGYGRASNRTWRKNPTDPSEQYDWLYKYDGLQRLKNAERGTLNGTHTAITSPQFGQCWSLDATGNWENFRQADEGSSWTLEQTRSANPVNEITGINNTLGQPWAQPAYDANGNMTTIPHPTGQQPLPSSSSSSSSEPDPSAFTATYDAWNRLLKLVDPETEETVQENHYDGRNFRITRGNYVEGVLDQTRHFYYTDDWRCVEERIDASTTPDRHFIWGLRYIDDLLCRDRSTTGTLNERLYALPDGNWNVTALVNSSGAVVERLEYDPYGQTTWLTSDFESQTESQFDWETTYCSYRWEAGVSLFQVRFRWYSPALGIWITRDPITYDDGPSLYGYCKESPCMYVDENGLWILATVLTASSVNPIGMIAAVVLFTAVVAYISINQPQLSLPRRKIASSKTKTIEFPKPEPRPLPLKGESVDPPPPPPQQQPDCRNRHPNWPECPTGRNKEPYSVAHEFLQNHCKSKSGDVVTKSCFPITEIKPACGVGGGIQYHCTLQDSCGELPSEYRVSVRCCNCCSGPLGKSTESCSCSDPHYSQGKVPPQCLSSATT